MDTLLPLPFPAWGKYVLVQRCILIADSFQHCLCVNIGCVLCVNAIDRPAFRL